MRIVSTFNESLYLETGRALIDSLRTCKEPSDTWIYTEKMETRLPGVKTIEIESLPELAQMHEKFSHAISRDMNGTNDKLIGFNQRWFNWFRKIMVQYDAIVRHSIPGLTVFVDSDVRMIKPLDESKLTEKLIRPVGILVGTREAAETGVVVYRGDCSGARRFITAILDLFLSGDFLNLPKWDDGYVTKHCADLMPDLVQDFAEGMEPITYRNSNGHETIGQVLPQTFLGDYFEHDKGVHWRRSVVPSVGDAAPLSLFRRCVQVLKRFSPIGVF